MIELEYVEVDGLLYPNILLDDAEVYHDLGKYGNLRLKYLHEQKPRLYRELLFAGKLAQHCAVMEQTAFEMAERIRAQYLKQHPTPLEGMERIQVFEHAQMITDELVTAELIYT